MFEIGKTEVYAKWIDSLADIRARAKILVLIERLTAGNPDDVKLAGGNKNSQAKDIKFEPCTQPVEGKLKNTTTTGYNVAGHLRNPEEMAAYFEACLEGADGDAEFIAKALGDIACAKGMTQVARDAGLSRESLYKALSDDRKPEFDTILKIIKALGIKLHAEACLSPTPSKE